MLAIRRFAAHTTALALILLTSACAGGSLITGADSNSTPLGAWPGHDWDSGARSGAFTAVAVDATERNIDPLTQRLRVETSSDGGAQVVRIFGSQLEGASAYLHLQYDEARVHPVETQRGELLDSDVLFLGVTSEPGIVVLGLTTVGGVALPSGEHELATVRFVPGAMTAPRASSAVSASAPDDLHFNGTTLEWTYNGAGDYDQNGETNIADLTPVGVHLNHSTSDGDHDPADAVVDSDANGLITLAELTAIGANFLDRTTEYQAQDAAAAGGPWVLNVGATVAVTAGVIPTGGGFREFSYTVPSPVDGRFYSVQVFDGATGGSRSNAVAYSSGGGFAPPQNADATDDGTTITVTWDAPASGTPTGYDVYVSDASDMTGAAKMNGAPVVIETFDCSPIAVPAGQQHYFAVRAIYSGGESGDSNIVNYGGGGGGGTPTNLAAVQEATQIRLDWDAVTGADSYNCYVGTVGDMSDGQMMHLPIQAPTTNTYLCPVVVDFAQEHYFAVKAVDDGTESAYSNIAHYIPGGGGDTTAPQWQGGIGIRVVEPDDAKVKVYWYSAIDPAPGTPPVQYLIYYSPEGTPIDWNNPIDVVDAPATSYTALGLTNGQKYEFAVRAQDGVPNVTSNTDTLFTTPAPIPPEGPISDIIASDVATVRMPGEEVGRFISVNHGEELWYGYWDGDDWVTEDLNLIFSIAERKYHPQALNIGSTMHILFGTETGIYAAEINLEAVPPTWILKPVASGYSEINGTGFAYDPVNNYLACVFAAQGGGGETLYYSDCNPGGVWIAPEEIVDGDPSIWQCDFAIAAATGAQWAAFASGPQVSQSQGVSPKFWYATRNARTGLWTTEDSGFQSSTEITIEIDPLINQPIVVNPETDWYAVPLAGDVPATDAAIYVWNGTFWDPSNGPIDEGDANNDEGALVFTTNDMGRDPQCCFTPGGKACATWTNVSIDADYSSGEAEYTLEGSWRLSTRPDLTWDKPSTLIETGIYSSNSVTAGESYQHVVTCYVGPSDFGDEDYIVAKYATRNHYPEGELYYFRSAWP